MSSAIIVALITAVSTTIGSSMVMHAGLKSNDVKQAERDTGMKKDLEHISSNQLKLTEKLELIGSAQNEMSADILVLKEKVKNSNLRIENLEKEKKK